MHQLDSMCGLALLFDHLPEMKLFVKNKHSQFIKANPSFLSMLGLEDEQDLIGKTDLDFFVHDIGQKYIDEDCQVMADEKPFVNRIWLVPNSDGLLVWYLCTKIPLFNCSGEVIGIAGTLRDYDTAGAVLEPYHEMAAVIKHITRCHGQSIHIEALAEMVHLSVSQFDRRFKKLFHLSPVKYINKVRIHAACQALSQTDSAITRIALDVGFYDHSYFTKKFKEEIGLTPKEYRKQYHQIC